MQWLFLTVFHTVSDIHADSVSIKQLEIIRSFSQRAAHVGGNPFTCVAVTIQFPSLFHPSHLRHCQAQLSSSEGNLWVSCLVPVVWGCLITTINYCWGRRMQSGGRHSLQSWGEGGWGGWRIGNWVWPGLVCCGLVGFSVCFRSVVKKKKAHRVEVLGSETEPGRGSVMSTSLQTKQKGMNEKHNLFFNINIQEW